MRTTTAGRLAPTLARQRGLITSSQLRSLGVDTELPRREGWAAPAPTLWSTVGDQLDDEQLVLAVALRGGLPSGALACRWWRLRDAPAGPAAGLVPHAVRRESGPVVALHRTDRLPRPVPHLGRRVAPRVRAVADAARWSDDLVDVRALVLAAIHDKRVRLPLLRDELEQGPRAGSALLARALDDYERGARSAPEAEVYDALAALPRGARVPPFLMNPELWLDGALLGRPDVYVPSLGIGEEVDSLRHHGTSLGLDATLKRHARFRDAGVDLGHLVPAVFREDRAGWAREFAARTRGSAHRPPPGLVVVPAGPLLPVSARRLAQRRRAVAGVRPASAA